MLYPIYYFSINPINNICLLKKIPPQSTTQTQINTTKTHINPTKTKIATQPLTSTTNATTTHNPLPPKLQPITPTQNHLLCWSTKKVNSQRVKDLIGREERSLESGEPGGERMRGMREWESKRVRRTRREIEYKKKNKFYGALL